MTVSQEKILFILFWSFVLGMALGLLYDVFRIRRVAYASERSETKLRRVFGDILVFFEDIIYSFICSVIVCIFLFYINSGRARGIAFFTMAMGIVLYYNTIGRAVIYFSEYVIRFIKYLVRKIYSVFLRPLLIILKLLCKITVYRLLLYFLTIELKVLYLKKAENGFNILKIEKQGKSKNEKSVKYIRQSGGGSVHSVLHGYNSEDAV